MSMGSALCALIGWAAISTAADKPNDVRTGANAAQADSKVVADTTFRASKLIGMNVRNHDGEKLGSVEDLVVDLRDGKVTFATIGVGGVLGIGETLYAVPIDLMAFEHGNNDKYFVLNMTKDKLQSAPSFDTRSWPNFSDPTWSQKIHNFYQQAGVTPHKADTTTRTNSNR